jgi:hypothetical protein
MRWPQKTKAAGFSFSGHRARVYAGCTQGAVHKKSADGNAVEQKLMVPDGGRHRGPARVADILRERRGRVSAHRSYTCAARRSVTGQ